jgi:hypothetical protein
MVDDIVGLFVLAARSQQLNPDEWVWKNVKYERVGRTRVRTAEELNRSCGSSERRSVV